MPILINDNSARVQYLATSGQTSFVVPFEFFENSNLKVYRNGSLIALGIDYEVTGAGVTGGGAVTLAVPAAQGTTLSIVRDIPIKRTSDFPLSGPFVIEALNGELDRLTAIAQEAETQIKARAVRLADSDTSDALQPVPVKTQRAGKLFYWNDQGQPDVLAVGAGGGAGGSGAQTFYQAAPPATAAVGDLWFDTDNGNKNYRFDGTNWVSVQDGAIADAKAESALAVQTANDALELIQAAADGYIDSYYQASAPGAANEGDLWFDTDDGNKLYRYTGGAWTAAGDNRIATALTNAAGAQATADGKVKTFFATTSPTATGVGDLWFDTDDNNKLYRWSGAAWVLAQDQNIPTAINNAAVALATANQAIALAEAASDGFINTYFQASAPSVASSGDLWFDTDDANKLYRYSGSAWVSARDGGVTSAVAAANGAASDAASALATATNAQATADGKVTTFYTNTTPTAQSLGDFWYRPTTGIVYRWSGTTWQDVASLGANWASNLAGIPSELLDNRIATAISAGGNINANRVSTSAIQSNAISNVVIANSTTSLLIGSSATVVQQASFTTTGGPLLITGLFQNFSQSTSGATGRYGVNYYLQSSPGGFGTQIYQSSQMAIGSGVSSFYDACHVSTVAQPAAGTYTLYLYALTTGSIAGAATMNADRILTITELKR